jgi:hypothetical protein
MPSTRAEARRTSFDVLQTVALLSAVVLIATPACRSIARRWRLKPTREERATVSGG